MADFQTAAWEKNAIGDDACKTLFTKSSQPIKTKLKLKKKRKLSQKFLENKKADNVIKPQLDTNRKIKIISKVNAKKLKAAQNKNDYNEVHQVTKLNDRQKLKSKKKLKRKIKEDLKVKDFPKGGDVLQTNKNKNSNGSDVLQANINKNKNSKKSNILSNHIKSDPMQKSSLYGKINETQITLGKKSHKSKREGSLRQRMLEKLKAARFRYLNEEMYTKEGKEAEKLFQDDPEAFQAYHNGYRQQVLRWPINPLDNILSSIIKLPKTHVIADFGCGEGRLAKSVPQKVHSFDLVALNDDIVACDMSKVPLKQSSVDVVVFCLSLMGTNLYDYLIEASRVLKTGGLLKIAEVESRFQSPDIFIKGVECYGFKCSDKDFSHNLFYFFDFRKESNIKKINKLPNIILNPCLYKKR